MIGYIPQLAKNIIWVWSF